jgi:hypothetical protein
MVMDDSYLYWTIAEGGGAFGTAMPAQKDTLSADEIWSVIRFLQAWISAILNYLSQRSLVGLELLHSDTMHAMNQIRIIARNLKRDIRVYQLVLKDNRTPLPAKIFLGMAVGYFFLAV